MIDTLLNLVFRCAHRRLTRPLTSVSQKGMPYSETYVVCLDCGKQFEYDLKEMHVGKAIDHSHDACVVPKGMPIPPKKKMKYAVAAALPVAAVVIGRMLLSKKKAVPTLDAPVPPDP